MNLPNKLTMLRILLVPVMVVIASINYFNNTMILWNQISLANFINVLIFIVASLTDLLDGKIARKTNQVTTFGKFADPLADKLLVITAMIILFMQYNKTNHWWFLPLFVLIIIIAREFIVSGIRLVAAGNGKIVAAGWLGKIKTTVQMAAIIILFFHQVVIFDIPLFGYVGAVTMYAACVLTVLSGIEYFMANKDIILESI